MKKKVLFSLCLLATLGLEAQVGVNNTDPKASLHITPQKTDGTTAEGIIAPNLTRAQLISKDARYTVSQKGAIVYVTTVNGTVSTKTAKITTVGYYYFDGALWQPFSQAETVVPTEPWQVQGTTNAATTNAQNIYQTGSVGIGASTAVPAGYKLLVSGSSKVTGALYVQETGIIGTAGKQYPNANYALHVMGEGALGGLWVEKRASLKTSVSIGESLTAADNALKVYAGTTELNGATSVNSTLKVSGATTIASTGSFTLAGNGVGAGKYLASDANGKGTWTSLPAAATEPWRVQGTTNAATSNTENIYQAGTVSVGSTTAVPAGYKLLVSGASQVTGALNVQETGRIGIVGKSFPNENYTLHVMGGGALGGLWVEKRASLKTSVSIGESLTAADNALKVYAGTTELNGATSVNSTLKVSGATTIASTGSFTLAGNGVGTGKYLASDANGKGTWTTLPATATTEPWRVQGGTTVATTNTENIYQAGTVSIGSTTAVPAGYKLLVSGSSKVNGALYVQETGIIGIAGKQYPNTNYALHVMGEGALGGLWVEKRASLKTSVSIGESLTAADNALKVHAGTTELNGATTITSSGSFTLAGNGVGAGKYLASDANGKGTWTTLPATATTEPWRVQGGTTVATTNTENIYQAGTVSIGSTTAVPAGYKLLVSGSSKVDGALYVQETGIIGTAGKQYPNTNYALHVMGEGALGGLWVEKRASLKTSVSIGESLTAADNALKVHAGTTELNGTTTIGKTTANANLIVNGNAGIGATPSHKLHVAGNEYISGRSRIGGVSTLSTMNASAQLDLADNNKGFLPNRVALTGATVKAPVANAVDGMMVYNTATVATQDLKPGFYYWRTNKWNRLVDEIPKTAISLLNLVEPCASASVVGEDGTASGKMLAFGDKVGTDYSITIPEDGSYAFSFRLYGKMTGISTSTTIVYYLNLMRGSTILDVAEMDIPFVKNPAIGQVLTYSVTLGADLKEGDKIHFRLGHLSATAYPWALSASNLNTKAARTSMIWWKL